MGNLNFQEQNKFRKVKKEISFLKGDEKYFK